MWGRLRLGARPQQQCPRHLQHEVDCRRQFDLVEFEAPAAVDGFMACNGEDLEPEWRYTRCDAVQRKFGFVETGVDLLLCLARGEEVRHIETELTRASWAQRRAA